MRPHGDGVSGWAPNVGVFEDLQGRPGRRRVARGEEAYQRVLDLIAPLESEGVKAQAPPEGFEMMRFGKK